MNKKQIAVGASLAVGGVMLVTSAFASAASSSGYDLYKTALKNMASVTSATTQMEVSVTDNGSPLAQVNSVIKSDRANAVETSSGTFDIKGAGSEQTSSFFNSGSKLVLKNGDSTVYKVIETAHPQAGMKVKADSGNGHQFNPYVEKVVDALVGNIAGNITLQKQADGSQQVNLQLTQSQIPALAQAITGLVLSHASSSQDEHPDLGKNSSTPSVSTIKAALPKLTDDIKLSNVDWSATVDSSDLIQKQNGSFEITGQDAAGKTHDLQIQVALNESGLNQTIPDTVDLTGQQVQVIQPDSKGSSNWHK